ncbi:MAG: type II secretion system major pseudopilin GspG [Stenotrophomonas sp.]
MASKPHKRFTPQAGFGRHQAGMSLLEIIIVIVLIGAVLTLVGSRVLGGADRGKANLAKSQIATMAGKIENYQLDTGRLPGRLEDLVTAPSGSAGWLGPYAKAAELNDPWGNALQYRVPGQGQPFDLVSLGKDGREGGSSYDADIRFE